MGWVFANWWQVLITIWFGGVVNELFGVVFKQRLKYSNWNDMHWWVRFNLFIAPLVWPVGIVFAFFFVRKSGATIEADLGGQIMSINFNSDKFRSIKLLRDLLNQFPPTDHRLPVISLTPDEKTIVVYIPRPDKSVAMAHFPRATIRKATYDEIRAHVVEVVRDHDEEQAAETPH